MIGNLIEGIRIIKLYGWEHPYLDLIIKQRDNEIRQNLTKNRFSSINKMMGTAGIGLVLFLTFLIHIKLGNTLTPGDVFSTVTLLLMNHQLINNIGANCVVLFFILYGSLKRINDALVMKNKEEFVIDSDDEFSVIANDLELSWKEKSRDQDIETTLNKDDSVVLCNLNFKLRKGELLVVIGPVGSGKSTLLMGLLQEISIAGGELKISQKPSYSGEDP